MLPTVRTQPLNLEVVVQYLRSMGDGTKYLPVSHTRCRVVLLSAVSSSEIRTAFETRAVE